MLKSVNPNINWDELEDGQVISIYKETDSILSFLHDSFQMLEKVNSEAKEEMNKRF